MAPRREILREIEHGTPDTPERVATVKRADALYRKAKPLGPLDWRRIWREFEAWCKAEAWVPEWDAQQRKLRALVEAERRRARG